MKPDLSVSGETTFDDILEQVGPIGRFRMTQISMGLVGLVIVTATPLSFLFLGFEPPHTCKRVNESQFLMTNGFMNDSLENTFSYKSCDIEISSNQNGSVYDVTIVPCPKDRNFSEAKYTTMLSEWDMVCEAIGQAEISNTVFVAGQIAGGLIGSALTDHFGRKPVFLSTALLVFVFEAAVSFSVDIYMVSTLRFFCGMTRQAFCEVYYIHAIEFLLPKQINVYGNTVCFIEFASRLLLGMIAYSFQDSSWRYLQSAIAALGVFSVAYPFFLYETPRWLVTKNKYDDALQVLKKICKQNKADFEQVKITFQKYISHVKSESQTESFFTLIRHRETGVLTMITAYVWFAQNLIYFGLFMTSSELAGNRFLNYCLMVCVEFPTNPFNFFVLERVGRRRVCIIGLALAVFCLFLSTVLAIYGENFWCSGAVFTVLFISGKLFITSSYNVLFIWTPEIFPTSLRSTGCAFVTCAGRLGIMVATYLRPMISVVTWGPGMIFTVCGVLCLFLTNYLPETKDKALPNTIQEMKRNNKQLISKEEDQPSYYDSINIGQ